MYLTKIYLKNFRNIREAELCFDKNLNVFVGDNAQGKTNLCEAISVCLGGSFRKARFSQFIPANDLKAEVNIRLFFRDDNTERENIINYTICRNNIKITYNDIKMKDAAELYGVLKYVIFIPDHLNLIKGSPDLRRDYLDDVALMQTKTHFEKLSRYNKALKQRNNILSVASGTEQKISEELAAWNEILSAEGINVTYGRLKYFNFLKKCAANIYSELTNNAETLDMNYFSSVFKTDSINFEEKDVLYNIYMDKLRKNLPAEMRLGYTLSGVHRDDVDFLINGMSAKEFASQGQIRSIALSLKLSEAEIIRRKNKTNPVVILDDILSELDNIRRNFIFHHIEKSQIFITCCNKNDLAQLNYGKAWSVEKGNFMEIKF